MRDFNPDLDQALPADNGRELRRVLRWPTVDGDQEPADSTSVPCRRAPGAASRPTSPRPVRPTVRVTRVVYHQTVVTEMGTIPERPLREEAAGKRFKALFWLSLGAMGALVATGQQGRGVGVTVMILGVIGALAGCVGALVRT